MARRRNNRPSAPAPTAPVIPPPVVPPPPPEASATKLERLHQLLAAKANRRAESLKLFKPIPHLEAFHADDTRIRVLLGGNRSSKAQPVDEPILTPDGWQPIGKLEVGGVVIGGDGKPCVVEGVFPQGVKPVFRVTFSDGATTRCCEEHLWKVKTKWEKFGEAANEWRVIDLAEIRRLAGDDPPPAKKVAIPVCVAWMPSRTTPLDPYVLGVLIGDANMTSTLRLSSNDGELIEEVRRRLPPGMLLKRVSKYDFDVSRGTGWVGGGERNVARDALRQLGLWGQKSHEKFIPFDYLFNSVAARLELLQGLMDSDGHMAKQGGAKFTTTSERLANDVTSLVRSLGGRCRISKWYRNKYSHKGEVRIGRPYVVLSIRLVDFCPFKLSRKVRRWQEWRELDRCRHVRVLETIREAGSAECVCIRVSSPDHTYVTNDFIVTHNTQSACVEFSRAVTGQDPYNKWPKEDGVFFVFGPDGKHLGNNIYKKIFRSSDVYMVRDPLTRRWRAWEPTKDIGLDVQRKRMPPLIPHRFIKHIAWEEKKTSIPKMITFKNGWEAHFFSAHAELPRGQAIDGWWIDEEVAAEGMVAELMARSVDRKGRGLWSATPQYGSNQLFELCERDGDGSVKVHKTHILHNIYIAQAEKEEFLKGLSEDEKRVRWDGEFLLSGFTIYPEFQVAVHGWRQMHFQVPRDWATVMVVDPGRQRCAVTLAAYPPPYQRQCVLIYDECYIEKCDAKRFGTLAAEKSGGRVHEMAFIDPHAASFHDIGSGLNVKIQYEAAFKAAGGRLRNGTEFTHACDDVAAGIEAVRAWLRLGSQGDPFLWVYAVKTPNLIREFARYRYAPAPRDPLIPDDKPLKKNDHLMDCVRYLALSGFKWRKPADASAPPSPAFLAFQEKLKHKAAKQNALGGLARGISLGMGSGGTSW